VSGAGYFIYQHTFYNTTIPLEEFVIQIKTYLFKTSWILPLLIGLTLLNWFLEIFKWQVLVNRIQKISLFEACKQSLSSHTLSLLTPFKLGEYAGKSLYFSKDKRKKIWLLNLGGNSTQLLMTLIFGLIGLVYFIINFEVSIHPHKLRNIAYLIALIILFIFGGVTITKAYQKGNYYKRLVQFYKRQSKQKLGLIILLSFLRYLVFSHQFYFLLLIFGVDITYTTALLSIFTMYFLATMLPTINLFDFVIKGSVAIYLFSFLGVDELIIISISMLMWLLNFALPAIVGSYFVLSFKTEKKYSNEKIKTDLKGI